jgi:uncharacterized protein (DUF697 family)
MHNLNCQCSKCQGADLFEYEQFEFPGNLELYGETEWESPFSEAEEVELAAELLSVSNEAELDQFLGNLIKAAGKIAKPLGRVLKTVAKKALPLVGGALGTFIPIPGVGTALGSALGGALGKALELEFAGLNQEDQEFETARRFVRMAGTAARQAALSSPDVDPQEMAEVAVIDAARQHVPNLPASVTEGNSMGSGARGDARTGRWIRRGQQIVVIGV